ncbi:hypothetical protein [Sinomonas terrae]|uniref:Nucleotidyltransferase n=1 Tax=Sinomonas terrae TaxID=2908838 RepID=A0ABS9U0X0_9MICC|nr:hypothetical protein [Sinomonas terrae]MCH6469960.1 hypothetical protein [Sinomonas terrae]
MERVLVRTAADGAPRSFTRGSLNWRVAAEPVRWYERVRWWEAQRPLPRGLGRVDVEVWQVQATPGQRGGGLTTFQLVRDATDGWSLRGRMS